MLMQLQVSMAKPTAFYTFDIPHYPYPETISTRSKDPSSPAPILRTPNLGARRRSLVRLAASRGLRLIRARAHSSCAYNSPLEETEHLAQMQLEDLTAPLREIRCGDGEKSYDAGLWGGLIAKKRAIPVQ
ncbi:hypothetical protein N7468_003899 [Penicillium chermesinum]|uniref:Uncharacterized protein n=1 Tax=Penicillium chermesinum TaxID=63820 RepID=A0A9W9P7S9_9EURO|nr:uncharacterized protein N7468_003899 [Penicillium chermesinum]KAJ5239280.1 hypothetical protein N7468_003899 [Penicillium chermesinum]